MDLQGGVSLQPDLLQRVSWIGKPSGQAARSDVLKRMYSFNYRRILSLGESTGWFQPGQNEFLEIWIFEVRISRFLNGKKMHDLSCRRPVYLLFRAKTGAAVRRQPLTTEQEPKPPLVKRGPLDESNIRKWMAEVQDMRTA